jgi:hypothetical protein
MKYTWSKPKKECLSLMMEDRLPSDVIAQGFNWQNSIVKMFVFGV